MQPPIELDTTSWQEVQRILQAHVPKFNVWAFGSRARHASKPYSDLDLAVMSDHPMSLAQMADIQSAFEESDLPIRVDVVDWGSCSEAFRAIIARDKIVVQQAATGQQG